MNFKKNNCLNLYNLFNILYKESIKALKLNEVPVSALVYDPYKKKIISRAHNLNKTKFDPCAHAEIKAIQKACKHVKKSRLDGFYLICSLEPCLMCSSVILQSKISRVYFSLEDKKTGSLINNFKLAFNTKFSKKIKIYYGFDEERFSKLLKDFFKNKR